MNPCVLAYLPPARQPFNTQTFIANFRKYRPKLPLILFSDSEWPEADVGEIIKVTSAEKYGLQNSDRQFAMSNLIFLTGVRILLAQQYDAMLYLEEDCRFGKDGWDETIFTEFARLKNPPLMAGSLVGYNVFNAGPIFSQRWSDFTASYHRRKYPLIPSFGFKGMADTGSTAVFPCGAGGIYTTAGLKLLLKDDEIARTPLTASTIPAWDQHLGFRLFEKFGVEALTKVAHLKSMFSTYGSNVATIDQRIAGLESGRFKLVHQIKTPWVPG